MSARLRKQEEIMVRCVPERTAPHGNLAANAIQHDKRQFVIALVSAAAAVGGGDAVNE